MILHECELKGVSISFNGCIMTLLTVVDFLLAEARINNIHNPINGQRCFSNVCRDNAFPTWTPSFVWWWCWVEDSLLLMRRQGPIQRICFHRATVSLANELVYLQIDLAARILNFLLSCKEKQYVAFWF